MRKPKLICLLLFILLQITVVLSQINPRLYNENYMQTFFLEDFNEPLNRNVWKVEANWKRANNLNIWVDSPSTVSQSNGCLNLSMIHSPGYTCINPDGIRIYADYIAGEVTMIEPFSYGSFECRAFLASGNGAFPAFWGMGINPCTTLPNNEIDFVELKANHDSPTLDYGIFYWKKPCNSGNIHPIFTEYPFLWGGWHTFKCIWSPIKITFWVNNTLLSTVPNNGDYWYPQYPLQVILSQQVTDPIGAVVAPQTSYFDYVRVKKFFLAPEITCPTIICSSGTATMDVDPAATNISWALTPSMFFNGATTGIGATANINASPIYHGRGKITYTFNMPSGETFTAEKDVWIKGPDVSEVSFDVYRSDGVHATNMYGTWILCPNTTYHIYVMNSSPVPLADYNWTVPSAWTKFYTLQNIISINTNSSPGGPITVNATNTATGCNNTIQIITGYMGSSYDCGSYYLSFSPNPATNETTLEIIPQDGKTIDENTQWELEVYDQQQSLKEKNSKIKGKQTKLNTSAWKDGVYIVRVKIGDEMISEKLVVKH